MSSNQINQIIVRVAIRHDGNYLVLRKSPTSRRAGAWEIPGGHLEHGESLDDGAKREVLEETGIKLSTLKYESSAWYTFKNKQRFGVTFTAEVASEDVTISHEHDKYEWINKDNFNNIQFDDVYQSYFSKMFLTDKNAGSKHKSNAKLTTKLDHLIIYTDGGSRGNPGPSATGYVLMNEDEEVLEEGGEYLGITTNNQAEYQAVKLALQQAEKFQPGEIDFYIDSLLVVNQMKGVYKIKNRELWPIHEAIKELSEKFERVSFTHVRREFNTMADSQVNQVLDSYEHKDR